MPNLLLGTNNGTQNFKISDNGFSAKLEPEGDGVKVVIPSHNDEGWLTLEYDDGHSREVLSGPGGDVYTLVFEAKSNVKNATIVASHRQSNAKENQISFGTATFDKANKWTQFVLTGSLNGTPAALQVLYLDLRNNPAGTEISIRNLKLVKGS